MKDGTTPVTPPATAKELSDDIKRAIKYIDKQTKSLKYGSFAELSQGQQTVVIEEVIRYSDRLSEASTSNDKLNELEGKASKTLHKQLLAPITEFVLAVNKNHKELFESVYGQGTNPTINAAMTMEYPRGKDERAAKEQSANVELTSEIATLAHKPKSQTLRFDQKVAVDFLPKKHSDGRHHSDPTLPGYVDTLRPSVDRMRSDFTVEEGRKISHKTVKYTDPQHHLHNTEEHAVRTLKFLQENLAKGGNNEAAHALIAEMKPQELQIYLTRSQELQRSHNNNSKAFPDDFSKVMEAIKMEIKQPTITLEDPEFKDPNTPLKSALKSPTTTTSSEITPSKLPLLSSSATTLQTPSSVAHSPQSEGQRTSWVAKVAPQHQHDAQKSSVQEHSALVESNGSNSFVDKHQERERAQQKDQGWKK